MGQISNEYTPSIKDIQRWLIHSDAWINIIAAWLNPPYYDDRHGEEKRLELAFLKSTMSKLVCGGKQDDLQLFFANERCVSNFLTGYPTVISARRLARRCAAS